MKGFSTTRARRWTQAQLQAGDAGDEQQAMEEHGPLGARSEAPGAHVARLVNVSCPGTQNVLNNVPAGILCDCVPLLSIPFVECSLRQSIACLSITSA